MFFLFLTLFLSWVHFFNLFKSLIHWFTIAKLKRDHIFNIDSFLGVDELMTKTEMNCSMNGKRSVERFVFKWPSISHLNTASSSRKAAWKSGKT